MAAEPILILGIAGYLGFWLFAADLEREEFAALRMATPSISNVVLQGWLFGCAGAFVLTVWLTAAASILSLVADGSIHYDIVGGLALITFAASLSGVGIGLLVSRVTPSENGAVAAVALSLVAPIVIAVLGELILVGSGLAAFAVFPLLLLQLCLIAFRSLR